MSMCDRHGVQIHPEPFPETVDAKTGEPVVVVRFGDGAETVTTPADMCASMGVEPRQFQEAMDGLVSSGWLTLLPDGAYLATIPDGDQ